MADPASSEALGAGADFKAPALGGARVAVPQSLARYGLILAFLILVVVFSALRPDSFPTWDNFISMLNLNVPLLLLGIVLTVPMVMGDFDLSITAVAQLAGAVALYSMLDNPTLNVVIVVVLAILVGLLAGTVNGVLVASTGISAFILTLALGSVATGLELAIAGQSNFLTLEINPDYLWLARTDVGPIPLPVIVTAFVAVCLWFLMNHMMVGRSMRAIGGNAVAAHLAGISVRRVRLLGFVVVGFGAALAGIFLTARSQAYYPMSAAGLLLPAYTGVFIGATMGRTGQFNVPGTCFGILFMATLSTGLVMLDQPAWLSNVVSGVILAAAVILTRATKASRAT